MISPLFLPFRFTLKDNGARLVIESCQLSDSGEYTCTASVGATSVAGLGGTPGRTVKLVLEVSRVPVPPSQPRIQVIKF